jgi:hypothetical protein
MARLRPIRLLKVPEAAYSRPCFRSTRSISRSPTSPTSIAGVAYVRPDVAVVTSRVERVGQRTAAGAEFARSTSHLRGVREV